MSVLSTATSDRISFINGFMFVALRQMTGPYLQVSVKVEL